MRKKNLAVIIFASICVFFRCQMGLSSPLFYDRLDFAAGDGPISVAIGDLDGNGDMDLAVTNWFTGNVSVLVGQW